MDYTFCKQIWQELQTHDVPIIILGSFTKVKAKVNMIKLGTDDFITKPFDIQELRARINRIIKRKKIDTSLNPHTHLPGSSAIQKEVQKRLVNSTKFVFDYIDADNFKAYNDIYGYTRSDKGIKKIANIIPEKTNTFPDSANFNRLHWWR